VRGGKDWKSCFIDSRGIGTAEYFYHNVYLCQRGHVFVVARVPAACLCLCAKYLTKSYEQILEEHRRARDKSCSFWRRSRLLWWILDRIQGFIFAVCLSELNTKLNETYREYCRYGSFWKFVFYRIV